MEEEGQSITTAPLYDLILYCVAYFSCSWKPLYYKNTSRTSTCIQYHTPKISKL